MSALGTATMSRVAGPHFRVRRALPVAAGRGLLVAALPDSRASPRHRLAAPVVGMTDQPRCDQRSRANGGGDAEIR